MDAVTTPSAKYITFGMSAADAPAEAARSMTGTITAVFGDLIKITPP